jgi:UDP-glucuronate decarboxylase
MTPGESISLSNRVDFQKLSGLEILLTGASGMVGAFLASALIECCLVRDLPPPKLTLLSRNSRSSNLTQLREYDSVEIVETDLIKWQTAKRYDVVIHAASPASPTKYGDPASIVETNVGFLKSLGKQTNPGTVLFVSSGEVYGTNPPLRVDETYEGNFAQDNPRFLYPKAKLSAENALWGLAAAGNTKPLVARLFHSFGPGLKDEDGRSFGDFLWSAARDRDLELLSSGTAIRTFLYLEDSVAGLLTVLTEGSSGQIYNVGSEEPVSIINFASRVASAAGVQISRPSIPEKNVDNYMHSPTPTIVPSNQKLCALGWSQKVSLEEGIRRSLNWIRLQLKTKHEHV